MTQSLIDLTENAQMYLVEIARLCETESPVPLSHLAHELEISSSAANEMCRKLEKQGYLVYQPYKGVHLTSKGEENAYYLLRRHRLWEVFLVERLGLTYDEAHTAACHLEHATSDQIADRLEAYLGAPAVNPRGMPIPGRSGDYDPLSSTSLFAIPVGVKTHVLKCELETTSKDFLEKQGIRAGCTVKVIGKTSHTVLLEVESEKVVMDGALAERIIVDDRKQK